MIKDKYLENAEIKIVEVRDMVSLIKKSIEKKQMSESILVERLNTMEKDLEQALFQLSLC
jgi:hypothetical protein